MKCNTLIAERAATDRLDEAFAAAPLPPATTGSAADAQ